MSLLMDLCIGYSSKQKVDCGGEQQCSANELSPVVHDHMRWAILHWNTVRGMIAYIFARSYADQYSLGLYHLYSSSM